VYMYVYTHNEHWACGCKFYLINLNENFCVSLEVLTITGETQKKKES